VTPAVRWIGLALVAAVALVGAYALLGGGSYAPAAVASPCAPRHWRPTHGLSDLENEIALSALNGIACRLHVQRDELVLAFTSDAALRRFARRHRISDARLGDATQAGLVRAIDDGEHAGEINGIEAFLLRAAARNVPKERLIQLVRGLIG
jgi:hypothetical protein